MVAKNLRYSSFLTLRTRHQLFDSNEIPTTTYEFSTPTRSVMFPWELHGEIGSQSFSIAAIKQEILVMSGFRSGSNEISKATICFRGPPVQKCYYKYPRCKEVIVRRTVRSDVLCEVLRHKGGNIRWRLSTKWKNILSSLRIENIACIATHSHIVKHLEYSTTELAGLENIHVAVGISFISYLRPKI